MKRLLLILPIVVVLLLACNNGKQEQAMEQRRIQDSIEQARLDSVERVRQDSLEQLRKDSIAEAVIQDKIQFLKYFIAKFDYHFNQDGIGPVDFVRNNMSDYAYDQLDPLRGNPEEEGNHDIAYFLDGYIILTSHDVVRVGTPKISHVKGNWFKISSKLYDELNPDPDSRYSNASYQVMVEEVDGRYLITKLKINSR